MGPFEGYPREPSTITNQGDVDHIVVRLPRPRASFSDENGRILLDITHKASCKSFFTFLLPWDPTCSFIMPPISQLSDAYASSTYELDLLDNLTLPAPEDSTTDPSYSQQTLASIPCSSPSQPLQPPSFPSFLQRVGPDRRKPYFLYSHMSKDQFVA
jgi:hypothetical protein